jgi:lactoylglutathione lyase
MNHNPRTGLRTYILSFTEGSTRLELMERTNVANADPSVAAIGYIHISIAVGSKHGVDLLTRRLVDDGYPVVSGPRTTGDGYYESCILGPEGIQIEIAE